MDIEMDLLCYKIFILGISIFNIVLGFNVHVLSIQNTIEIARYMELFRQIKGNTFN